jgi:hypothetical protein
MLVTALSSSVEPSSLLMGEIYPWSVEL